MGSFNYVCGISGSSIHEGERIGMIPLVKNKFRYSSKWFRSITDDYIPVAPAVYGKYDEHGGLYNIEDSPINDYLESVYQLPLDVLLNCTFADAPSDYEVIDYFYGKENIVSKNPYSDCDDEALSALGFSLLDDDPSVPPVWMYENHALMQNEEDNRRVFSLFLDIDKGSNDTDSISIGDANVMRLVEEFHEATSIWLGLDPQKSKIFDNASQIVWMPFVPEFYENILEHGDPMKTYHTQFEHFINDLNSAFETYSKDNGSHYFSLSSMMHSSANHILNLNDSTYHHIKDYPKLWKFLFSFADVMTSANSVYAPSAAGEQMGNHLTEKVIGELLVKRAQNQVDEMEL